MSNTNHKRAARLLARERDISYAHAVRLVRDEDAYPDAWTYRFDDLLTHPPARAWTPEPVLRRIEARPEMLPFFDPQPSMPVGAWQRDFAWSEPEMERCPVLRGLDTSSHRVPVRLFEPYASLLWTAYRSLVGWGLNPEDAAFDFDGRESLFDDLLLSPGFQGEGWDLPPSVPNIARQLFEDNDPDLDLPDLVAGLERHLERWPSSVDGWHVLGLIYLRLAGQQSDRAGWLAARKSAWRALTSGRLVAEGALRRSRLRAGYTVPYGHHSNRPFLWCVHDLALLTWSGGGFEEAERLGRNLLVLDSRDPLNFAPFIEPLAARIPLREMDLSRA